MRKSWWCVAWLLAWTLLAGSPAWAEPPPPDCSNPRSAADTLFTWLTPDAYDPAKAMRCMDVPPGQSGERLAVQLKQVLDARGLYMPIASMPAAPDTVDTDGIAQVVPLTEFPVVVLLRADDGQWQYSRQTVEAVPTLYADTFSPLSVWFQSRLPGVFYQRILGLHLWQYVYGLLLFTLALAVGTVARLLLRRYVARAVAASGLRLDDATYGRTNLPLIALVVFGVVAWGLPDLQLNIAASVPASKALGVAITIAALIAVSRFINVGAALARTWAEVTDSRLDDQAIPLLRQAAQLVLVAIGGLYLADAIGLDVWKLAAGVGIGGLAFALAAQDTVANVFGSVNIFLDRPFQIGDWVKIGAVEGVVEEVGFRSTRVRTFYNSMVTIPNSQITNANVDNLGVRPRRRIKLTLGLTYDTPADTVQAYVEGVQAVLAAHPMVERTYEVHLYNFGDSALQILVYYHVITPGWHEELVTRSQNMLEFMRLADTLGVRFAFPSTSVYIEASPSEPLAKPAPTDVPTLQATAERFGPGGDLARPSGVPFTRSWTVQARNNAEDRGTASDDGG